MEAFISWLAGTPLHYVMNNTFAWPIAESLHFIGLSLLLGTVGLFDLRLMGFAKKLPLAALHKLVPWGVLGYAINLATGISFFVGAPDQYLYNPAFQIKLAFMGCAGINVAVFYLTMFRSVKLQGGDEVALLPARIIGGVSLVCWIGVMSCGRLLTFYRPPYHWCPWC